MSEREREREKEREREREVLPVTVCGTENGFRLKLLSSVREREAFYISVLKLEYDHLTIVLHD